MARVPAVTNISKDTAAPDERDIDVDAGVLDVDAEVPDDYDWDALPDDDDELIANSDEDGQLPEPPQDPEPPHPPSQLGQPSTEKPSPNASRRESSLPNGHSSPPSRDPYDSRDPYVSRDPYPSKSSPESKKSRSDGVVADPMGVDSMEEGEIDQRWSKKKKKKKSTEKKVFTCDICDISVNSQITMDAHIKGQKHIIKQRQAALTERNKRISEHGKAILSQNEPPRNALQTSDERKSTNTPPKRQSAGPSDMQRVSDKAEEKSRPRDPYAPRDVGRPAEPSRDARQSATDDSRHTSRDLRPKSRVSDADRGEASEKEKGTSDARDVMDPYASRNMYASRDPYAAKVPYKANPYSTGDPYATREPKKPRNPSSSKAAETNASHAPKDSSPQPNGGRETRRDSDEGRKRKNPDDSSNRSPVHLERNSPDKPERAREYELIGDGTLRRKLDDSLRDPRLRDPYVNAQAPQTRPLTASKVRAPSNEQTVPPLPTSEPMKPKPPPLISAPAPSSAQSPTERRDERRPPDQTRRFTYGSVTREPSVKIPEEWLSQPMDTNEWRDLRNGVFERGDEVDRLAFKMLQEILLSPVLGISGNSLAPYSKAMLDSVKNQHMFSDEAYAKFADFPKPLTIRDENFAKGDPEWQKSQTPEDLAVKLVSDNILFCLNSYEDNEDVGTTELHNLPRRGSFGQKNMVKSSRDGGVSPRYQDSVEQDKLFNELYEHLLYRNVSR